jgi:hypothetical protein
LGREIQEFCNCVVVGKNKGEISGTKIIGLFEN